MGEGLFDGGGHLELLGAGLELAVEFGGDGPVLGENVRSGSHAGLYGIDTLGRMSEPLHVRFERVTEVDGPQLCEPILRSVPEWFGIESSTRAYVEATSRLPTWIAKAGEAVAGFITLERHEPRAAEIHCMAVHRAFHGRGVGSAMVRLAERILFNDGFAYLQVKTMGPSKPNAEYARTLRFYESAGFVRLQEFQGIWPGIPCLVLVKRLEDPGRGWAEAGPR